MLHMVVVIDKRERQWRFGMWLPIVHIEEIRFIVNISWLGRGYKGNGELFRRPSVRRVDKDNSVLFVQYRFRFSL